MKVLLHVSALSQWKVAVGNAKNLLEIHPDALVEIVVNSVAIDLFNEISDSLLSKLSLLSSLNVSVKLCRNSLKFHNIPEASLPSSVEVVPAGIAELVQKQQEGYAYVSP